jgi:hypothetical protein
METIKIQGTDDTPTIVLDPENMIFEISGRSMPEDVASFYQPILDWMDRNLPGINDKIIFVFKMDYFNTASSKMLLDILVKLEDLYSEGKDIVVHWYYKEDDEDMMEAGEEYADIVDVPFEIKELEN